MNIVDVVQDRVGMPSVNLYSSEVECFRATRVHMIAGSADALRYALRLGWMMRVGVHLLCFRLYPASPSVHFLSLSFRVLDQDHSSGYEDATRSLATLRPEMKDGTGIHQENRRQSSLVTALALKLTSSRVIDDTVLILSGNHWQHL